MYKVIMLSLLLCWQSSFANIKTELTQYAKHWRKQHSVPALSLYIDTPNNTIKILSGHDKLLAGNKLTADKLFGVGSITKTFVSAAVLKLQTQGKINLNDKVAQYLPEYPRWRDVTIKQLLNMRSGVLNTPDDMTVGDNTPDSMLADAHKYTLVFPPDSFWSYSNTNYLILGKIIERITKQSLLAVFKHEFFQPLGLKNTVYSDTEFSVKALNQIIDGYHDNKNDKFITPSHYGAAGAMFMNANDLATWAKALLVDKTVLTATELKDFLSFNKIPYESPRPKNTYYGLGIFMTKLNKHEKIIWYTGVIDGYSSLFLSDPSKKILLIAQINRWQDNNFALLFPNQDLVQHALSIIEKKIGS